MSVRTCPYCLSPITEQDRVTQCDQCQAVYHVECWEESCGCCVKSCSRRKIVIDVDIEQEPQHHIVLTREDVESAKRSSPSAFSTPCLQCGAQVRDGGLLCDRCRPAFTMEHEDIKNVGPILVALLVLGVLLAWIIVISVPEPKTDFEVHPRNVARSVVDR